MHNKNNNKTQTFTQGLRPFSNSIPKSLKKHLKKGGYNYSNIVDNWTRIVDAKISNNCYPSTVKMNKDMKDGILVLNVIHGKEIEIEYNKNEIVDKVNAYFGYNCIAKVVLKIVENKVEKSKKVYPKIKDPNKIIEKMKKINNDQLKNSLKNLLKAFNEKKL